MIQQEIEFLPVTRAAADREAGCWVLREVARLYRIEVSFLAQDCGGMRQNPACTSTPAWSRTASTSSTQRSGLTEAALKVIGGYLL